MVLSSRYFCSQRTMSASRARIRSSRSRRRSWRELTVTPGGCDCLCRWEITEYIRNHCNCTSGVYIFFSCQVGFLSYLLCPQTPQLLLQPCPQLHLQALSLLTGGLELGQSTLESLHFLHVSPLPPQLVLKLTTTAPCRLQSLLQPLRSGVLLLGRDSQALQLSLNPIPLNVLLLI